MTKPKRRHVYFCACGEGNCNVCEPYFEWYEPQDIEKGMRLAESLGMPGFFSPYKLCADCRLRNCRRYFEFKYILHKDPINA